MKIRKKISLGVVIVLSVVACVFMYKRKSNKRCIEDKVWVWVSGTKIGRGDFVEFSEDDDMFGFKNDIFIITEL